MSIVLICLCDVDRSRMKVISMLMVDWNKKRKVNRNIPTKQTDSHVTVKSISYSIIRTIQFHRSIWHEYVRKDWKFSRTMQNTNAYVSLFLFLFFFKTMMKTTVDLSHCPLVMSIKSFQIRWNETLIYLCNILIRSA